MPIWKIIICPIRSSLTLCALLRCIIFLLSNAGIGTLSKSDSLLEVFSTGNIDMVLWRSETAIFNTAKLDKNILAIVRALDPTGNLNIAPFQVFATSDPSPQCWKDKGPWVS